MFSAFAHHTAHARPQPDLYIGDSETGYDGTSDTTVKSHRSYASPTAFVTPRKIMVRNEVLSSVVRARVMRNLHLVFQFLSTVEAFGSMPGFWGSAHAMP